MALPPLPSPAAWIWRPVCILVIILAYVAIHAALRFIRDTIGVDDVEQIILAQSWELGYNFRQPPLYTWLLVLVQDWLGPGLKPLVVLRYGCFALLFLFCYLAARRLPLEPRLAGLCVLSLTLLYQIGWKMHVGVTHTVLLSACVFATVWLLLRAVARPGAGTFFLLGAVAAIGLLAKYGYVASLALLIVPMLLQPAGRVALLRPAALLVPVIALIGISPYLYWVVSEGYDFAAMTGETLGSSGDWQATITPALGRLAGAVAGFVAPLAFLVFLMMPRVLLPAKRSDDGGAVPAFDAERWLRYSLLLALLVLAAGAASGVATEFKERWMHPFLLTVPLWLFARIAKVGYGSDSPDGDRRLTWLWWAMIAVAGIAVLFRLGQDLYGEQLCGRCRLLVPFDRLADRLETAGFTGGTILASDEHIAGNLRAAFPDSRVLSQRYPFYVPPAVPASAGGQCLAVWNGSEGETLPRALDDLAASTLNVGRVPFLLGERVELGAKPVSGEPYVWYFHLDPDGRGDCR